MSESNNNNFRELKQLLKLKQHEVPPPGYFNHFSGDVIARIRAGESGGSQSVSERLGSGSFWVNLLRIFQAKPGVIGGFATSLCLLLLIGVVMADRSGSALRVIWPSGRQSDRDSLPVGGTPLLPASGNSGIAISSNAVVSLQPVPTLFGSQQNPLFQPAAFVTTGQ